MFFVDDCFESIVAGTVLNIVRIIAPCLFNKSINCLSFFRMTGCNLLSFESYQINSLKDSIELIWYLN